MRTVAAVLALGLAGCGVYSMRFDPPAAPPVAGERQPLDVSVVLGDVEFYMHGRRQALDEAQLDEIGADFVQAASPARLVRSVLPRGRSADLYVDTVRRVRPGGMTPRRSAYQILAFPFALVPGFPYPWNFAIDREVRIRGRIRDTPVLRRRYRQRYTAVIWGRGYWSLMFDDPLRAVEGERLAIALAEAIDADRDVFERFAAAVRADDPSAPGLGDR